MSLKGYKSLCKKNVPIIVSEDKLGGKQVHRAYNDSRSDVFQYQIDGVVLKNETACDFLLMKDSEPKIAFLIELKGSDLVRACEQLKATATRLSAELTGYELQYRIVANKCRTHKIESNAFRKFIKLWDKSFDWNEVEYVDRF